jgi:hypothetical protein
MNRYTESAAVIDELYALVKQAPSDMRLYFIYTATRCDVIHHADDSTIIKMFTLDRWTEKPDAILAQLRAYLATLAEPETPAFFGANITCEPEMATDADGRWIMKEAK